jgi:hypothetical protein
MGNRGIGKRAKRITLPRRPVTWFGISFSPPAGRVFARDAGSGERAPHPRSPFPPFPSPRNHEIHNPLSIFYFPLYLRSRSPASPADYDPRSPSSSLRPHSGGANPHDSGANPRDSGACPHDSGANPHGGGANPRDSGANPHGGGANPHGGGANPHDSGACPHDGGANPHNGGACPRDGGALCHHEGLAYFSPLFYNPSIFFM